MGCFGYTLVEMAFVVGQGVIRLLGLEKKITVSKALAESSNFRENKTEL